MHFCGCPVDTFAWLSIVKHFLSSTEKTLYNSYYTRVCCLRAIDTCKYLAIFRVHCSRESLIRPLIIKNPYNPVEMHTQCAQ